MQALDSISRLLPLEEWINLKKDYMGEIWHYNKLHPDNGISRKSIYFQTIRERALQKQQLEQRVLMVQGRN